jgi:hypothetical protein
MHNSDNIDVAKKMFHAPPLMTQIHHNMTCSFFPACVDPQQVTFSGFWSPSVDSEAVKVCKAKLTAVNTFKIKRAQFKCNYSKSGYNDIALYDTSLEQSDILRYQLIRHC